MSEYTNSTILDHEKPGCARMPGRYLPKNSCTMKSTPRTTRMFPIARLVISRLRTIAITPNQKSNWLGSLMRYLA